MFAELRSDIPLICVCGNHDVGNIPTKESVEEYRRNFGDDFFSFWVGGVKFIVINTQYYENSTKVSFCFKLFHLLIINHHAGELLCLYIYPGLYELNPGPSAVGAYICK